MIADSHSANCGESALFKPVEFNGIPLRRITRMASISSFAFLAHHMLTMSFVYFNIWQIKQTEPKDFAMGLIGFGKDIEICLGFDLDSLVAEADQRNMRDLHEVLRARYGSDNGGGAV